MHKQTASKCPEMTKLNIHASVYIHFWRYFDNYFYLFLAQMCTKRLVNICAKFLRKYVERFLIHGLRVKLRQPGSMYVKRPTYNRVNNVSK